MKEESINVLGKLLLFAIVFGLLIPPIAQAQQDVDARIERLEAQLRALQDKLVKLKAERAAPPVDKKEVETIVDKILAEKPRPEPGPSDLRVFWKEGLRLETRDKDFTLKLGGRIQNDWGWMTEDNDVKSSKGDLLDGTEFRRVRLYTSGTVYDNIDYKLQFDFAGGDADLKDAYLGVRNLPIGYLKMGHFKEPFGLEELTSSKYITFLERALPVVFAPSRNTGVMLQGTALAASDPRMTWATGIFRDADSYGEDKSEGGYSVTGRVTALPWYEDEGARLLHVGAAYSLRELNDVVRYRSRPEAHLAPYFVDTTALTANRAGLLGLESALVHGPFSLQGEYMRTDVDISSSSSFDGFYIQGSYFLTGEHRNYKTSAGAFDRVKPKENFHFGEGIGAWEVAARYSQLNLNDAGISGGRLKDATVGLNWYLNPNTRIMWNYVRAELDRVGNADLFLMRFQVDF